MNTKLHVGNLATTTTEKDLHILFSAHGNVAEVNLPLERASGRPQGFCIVTMATPQGAQAAILALHGKEVAGRVLAVTEHVFAKMVPPATGPNATTHSAAKQNGSVFRRLFGVF
jgi:RNA recognition motif-containing protein